MNYVTTVYDSKRGCGYRKKGGLYLMSGEYFKECGKLPIPLTVCPCCGHGIKPARGWTWVTSELIMNAECRSPKSDCNMCHPLGNIQNQYYRFGLLWVGEKFYKTPHDFMRESNAQGISRRISAIPNDFELDRTGDDLFATWVLLAHRKAIYEPASDFADEDGFVSGIFCVFKPTRIEYVVKGDETEEELERLIARGVTPVHVELKEAQMELGEAE
jgi:hypothetical protein